MMRHASTFGIHCQPVIPREQCLFHYSRLIHVGIISLDYNACSSILISLIQRHLVLCRYTTYKQMYSDVKSVELPSNVIRTHVYIIVCNCYIKFDNQCVMSLQHISGEILVNICTCIYGKINTCLYKLIYLCMSIYGVYMYIWVFIKPLINGDLPLSINLKIPPKKVSLGEQPLSA
jgi:hypothetical protein